MGHKNYTNYSKSSDNNIINQSDLEHIVLNGSGEIVKIDQNDTNLEDNENININVDLEDNENIDNENIEEVVPSIEDLVLKGVVNTSRLNVRKQPTKDSEVIQIITRDSEVEIGLDGETDTFYHVRTKSGVEGYCMKEFIDVK